VKWHRRQTIPSRDTGHDTRALQAYLGHKNIQHTNQVYQAVADAVQEIIAGVIAIAGPVERCSSTCNRNGRALLDGARSKGKS